MIKSVVVDVKNTFDGAVVFLGVEPKMKRTDRNDAKSPMVRDGNNWTVQLMVKVLGDDGKSKRENIGVTLESIKEPCGSLEEFDKVELERLEYNVMTTERGQAMVFWRVKDVRPFGSGSAGLNGAARPVVNATGQA